MSKGPSGTVTLVFTDIQDSSRLWEKHGRLFEPVLALHNQLMRAQITAHEGYEVKTEGDAFMVAFADALQALRFCADTQAALAAAAWPAAAGEVHVRMGVHTGEPIVSTDPASGRTDYFGPVVNRAARVAAAGHGGQVLTSESALKRAMPPDGEFAVTDLGEHRLRGLEQPEHLFQVLPPALGAREFPPLQTVSALPTNLPPQASSFIGRQNELAELCELLAPRKSGSSGRHAGTSPGTKLMRGPGGAVAREVSRLVALTGPGGTGKTRLAVRAGHELIDRFEGGVWFVDCSGATDAAGVAFAAALALGLRLTGNDNPVTTLGNVLQYRKPLLLILDNFEQVAAFAAHTIGTWRRSAPQVSFLVTSRAVLGLQGEQQYELAPLTPPPRNVGPADLDTLRACESVALFTERAQEADPKFELDADNIADVCRICQELDGLPLALELAASRVRMLKPAQMVKRLGRKFELLKSSRRDLSPRQQTMYGAVEWGFELLNEVERAAFLQAGAFHEGFLLEAAEAVIDLSAHDSHDVLDALQSLREKSLLRAVEGERETRFLMYRPILEFSQERWKADADPEQARAQALRHAAHYADYAWNWGQRVEGPEELEALDRLEAERENIVAAVETAAAAGQAEVAARAALGLWEVLLVRGPVETRALVLDRALGLAQQPLWQSRLLAARARAYQEVGLQKENLEFSSRAVDVARAAGLPEALCEALVQAANANWHVSENSRAADAAREAAGLARAAGRDNLLARALGGLGIVLINAGDHAEAVRSMMEAEKIWRQIGFQRGIAHNIANQGVVHSRAGRTMEATRAYEEAERLYGQIGYLIGVARMVGNRGAQIQRRGDLEGAIACYRRADSIARQIGAKPSIVNNVSNLGSALFDLGDIAGAMRCYEEALALARETMNRLSEGEVLGRMASVASVVGEHNRALDLRRQSRAIGSAIGHPALFIDACAAFFRVCISTGRARDVHTEIQKIMQDPIFVKEPLLRHALTAWGAMACVAEKDWPKAEALTRQYLQDTRGIESHGVPADRAFFASELSLAMDGAGQTAAAREFGDAARAEFAARPGIWNDVRPENKRRFAPFAPPAAAKADT
ncbi:MAG: tetratricopeptide repeat protein [Planctomycetes bacterium]|nr:tetratricopeptide repeat protein [Planctomycetota bacterium]